MQQILTDDEEWIAAKALIRPYGLSLMDVLLLGMDVIRASGDNRSNLRRSRKLIRLGEAALEASTRTVSFSTAVKDALASREERLRHASLQNIRTMSNRMMKMVPALSSCSVRALDTTKCTTILQKSFTTERQRFKGRSVLSMILSHARKRGWLDHNPVALVDVPYVKEQVIRALRVEECRVLLECARDLCRGECLVPAAIMLFAGIRPTEIENLRWGNISQEEMVVTVPPLHAKTGGGRHVSIQPVLARILFKEGGQGEPSTLIVPRNWRLKWRKVRAVWAVKTGSSWRADVLRHTFSSFFAKRFKDFARLQMEMGHASSSLLRTRYLNMEGITEQAARDFWEMELG